MDRDIIIRGTDIGQHTGALYVIQKLCHEIITHPIINYLLLQGLPISMLDDVYVDGDNYEEIY